MCPAHNGLLFISIVYINSFQADFNLKFCGDHTGQASEEKYSTFWQRYLDTYLSRWRDFNLFWHASFHNGTVSSKGVTRRPENLLVIRCIRFVRSHTALSVRHDTQVKFK